MRWGLFGPPRPDGPQVPGQALVDNNNGYSLLLHAAPELLDGQLKLLGSYATGKWDDANDNTFQRYAVGASYQSGAFNVRSEYMGGKWEDKFFVAEKTLGDAKPKGYYVKAFYQLNPQLRVLAGYSHLEHNFTGFFFTGSMNSSSSSSE